MKKIVITLLIGLGFFSTKAQNKIDSTILQKLNLIENSIQEHSKNHLISKTDSLVVSVSKMDELTNSLNKESNNWTPSLIALLVVLISTGGAVFIGIRQIKNQAINAEEQLKSQESQAQDNLSIAREQIQETSKMSLAQVRANNISQARINWMQDLRNEITNFNGEVALINFYLKDVVDFNEKGEKEEAEKLYNKQADRIKSARQYAFKIKLFLSIKEDNHKKLEELIDQYYKEALDDYSSVKSDFNSISNEILIVSRKILKEVWEQAKNEGA